MVALEDRGREDYRAKLARKIDDASPEHWLTADQCESELGRMDETK